MGVLETLDKKMQWQGKKCQASLFGEDSHFDDHMFQLGGKKKHQLDDLDKDI